MVCEGSRRVLTDDIVSCVRKLQQIHLSSPSPNPSPQRPSSIHESKGIPKLKDQLGLGLTIKSYGPPPHYLKLLSMKECSGRKVLLVIMSWGDPPFQPDQKK